MVYYYLYLPSVWGLCPPMPVRGRSIGYMANLPLVYWQILSFFIGKFTI